MGKVSLLQFQRPNLFLAAPPIQNPRCIDFGIELERSLDLFRLGFLAHYFSPIVAGTTALLIYLFFLKAFAKPKPPLAILSLLLTYFTVSLLINYLVKNVFSYCY